MCSICSSHVYTYSYSCSYSFYIDLSSFHSIFSKIYEYCCDFECLKVDGVVKFLTFSLEDGGSFAFCRSWYSWKHGTIHKFVWHSGQWYFVFRRNMRPCASMVFQQKLQPNAGPGRITGQCFERLSIDNSRTKFCKNNIESRICIWVLIGQ